MACNADGKSPPRKKRRVGRSGRAVKVPLEVVGETNVLRACIRIGPLDSPI